MTQMQVGAAIHAISTYSNMITGTINAAFTAQALIQQQTKCFEVLVQNDPASAVNLKVGNEFGQYVELVAGESITIPITDANKIYISTDSGTATVNYIAMV